jgi:hypothetical protein
VVVVVEEVHLKNALEMVRVCSFVDAFSSKQDARQLPLPDSPGRQDRTDEEEE